jgi:hypothetical protein
MKKTIQLQRVSKSDSCTIGVLIDCESGLPLMVTMERPWMFNKSNISCIPSGLYDVVPNPIPGNKLFHNSFHVKDVSGRSEICLHIGNIVNDSQGCILPGMTLGTYKNQPAVLNSGEAMHLLNKKFPEGFKLDVGFHLR